ncbi:hypothetical protein SLNWT_2132 [Streptomyces albus]|uniref:Integral membrane protein n=1 Tax=Streptomyces albus (strain ATCC 21838 / DSM 41398 / FERM P-419 / JCM 4703 / NBRC 107858) TaxID=1081613 RepID=A0A0B5EJQ1_STRA4|nr:hypothetical protein SLNWT_2132 [Streptomyces albus]AOU76823.1 hypothetical protein SLNHY_2132 [Streptomyces albus]AYN32600.1 hypothetical protein DUI70_2097 [Streptomyces albus]
MSRERHSAPPDSPGTPASPGAWDSASEQALDSPAATPTVPGPARSEPGPPGPDPADGSTSPEQGPGQGRPNLPSPGGRSAPAPGGSGGPGTPGPSVPTARYPEPSARQEPSAHTEPSARTEPSAPAESPSPPEPSSSTEPPPHPAPSTPAEPPLSAQHPASAEPFASVAPLPPAPIPVDAPGPPDPVATPEPSEASEPPAPTTTTARRPAVDPVKALLHRHRELCERAVDPLEIAAGLEAHGITDRTAARFRHRDVFSLAEEMYARVPREPEVGQLPAARVESGNRPGWALTALLPGAACALAVLGLQHTDGQLHFAVAVAGVLAVALGLVPALERGPLGGRHHFTPGTRVWICWLLTYALAGDGLLWAAVTGGPDVPGPVASAPLLALACAVAPAIWCAQLFASAAGRRLAGSRGLAEFTARARPLLLGCLALFLLALGLLLTLTAELLDQRPGYGAAGTLGALLLLSRLLLARGFTHAPAVVLAAAGLTEALALATVFAGRLPGCELLAVPVQRLVERQGPGLVPALILGAGALVLLLHALRTLTRASAHAHREDAP